MTLVVILTTAVFFGMAVHSAMSGHAVDAGFFGAVSSGLFMVVLWDFTDRITDALENDNTSETTPPHDL